MTAFPIHDNFVKRVHGRIGYFSASGATAAAANRVQSSSESPFGILSGRHQTSHDNPLALDRYATLFPFAVERIQKIHLETAKVADVTCHDCQLMHPSGGGDHGVFIE